MRALLGNRIPREAPSLDYLALMKELRAIGNRVSQIAARANTTGFFMAEEYARDRDALWEMILQIKAAVTLPDRF